MAVPPRRIDEARRKRTQEQRANYNAGSAPPPPSEPLLSQNVQMEAKLLSLLLYDSSLLPVARDALRFPNDIRAREFYKDLHQRLWKIICAIYDKGEIPEYETIYDEWIGDKVIERVDERELLNDLLNLAIANDSMLIDREQKVRQWATRLQKHALRRGVYDIATTASGIANANEEQASTDDLYADIQGLAQQVQKLASSAVPMASQLNDPLRPLSLAEMLDQPPPELLVDRILMRHGVSMFAGDGGSGKSLLLADLCIHIALGREWNGHSVRQGAVLIVAGEGGQGFAWRVKAWLEHYDMSLDDLTNFYIIPHAMQVLDDAQRARVIAYAKALPEPLALVAIETLSQTAGGADQNDNGEMAAYVRSCREIATALDTHVTFTHHALKTGNGYRGASALKDDSDTTILVSREGDVSTAHCEKQRDGWEYFPDFSFTGKYVSPAGANGLSYGVFEYTGLKERTAPKQTSGVKTFVPPSQQKMIDTLAQHPTGLRNGEWETLTGIPHNTFNSNLRLLKEAERVTSNGVYYILTELGRSLSTIQYQSGTTVPNGTEWYE